MHDIVLMTVPDTGNSCPDDPVSFARCITLFSAGLVGICRLMLSSMIWDGDTSCDANACGEALTCRHKIPVSIKLNTCDMLDPEYL